MFTDNYDSSFCFWVFEKKLTQENCFLFCEKYEKINNLNGLLSTTYHLTSSRTFLNAMMQCMFTDNYDSSFCFWVFEERLTETNCYLFCKKFYFFNNQEIFTVLLSKLSWSAFRGDKILVFHTRSRVVSAMKKKPIHKQSYSK